ncbi:AsmA family protein [Novosphingobium sp. SG707]|uniref:AsmA family protein n=1 Tax=Novosphingobium sp. SG707 TaxID=2586996 RepID=UPI001851F90B|nr:AsmA family protein [Novosphingobium sp. SG707]NKI98430.1 hypothetical protein [Novosphingobium sp. SG707]
MTAPMGMTAGSGLFRLRYLAVVLGLLVLAGLVGLAAFPWGVLKGTVERRLSQSIGRTVSIGAMERLDTMSFHPRIRLRAVRIPQPAWVEPHLADLAQIAQVDLSFSVWALLAGRATVERVEMRGANLQFYRTAQGRKNWSQDESGERSGSGGHLLMLRVADSRLRYLDRKRDRSLDVAVVSDSTGLRIDGGGLILGHRVRITGRGAAIAEWRAAAPWPFSVAIEGPAVGFALEGTMPSPLDLGHLQGRARAHAEDLRLLDAIIEAGLPGTQPVRLAAGIRRSIPDWTIDDLRGTIGRSDIAGHATIVKRDGRSRITGALRSDHFDFDDLSSNEGKRRAAAIKARLGPRILPGSAIDLTHVRRTDGALDLRVDHLLWSGQSPFRSMTAHLSLERSRLEISALRVGMTHGSMEGTMRIDQTDTGRPDPRLDLRLTLRGARLLDFFPRAQIDGSLIGRLAVTGYGHTLADAFGAGGGVLALVGRDGQIPARTAALLGQDVGRGLTMGKDETDNLRCVVARLEIKGGMARPAPVLIDSSRAQTQVRGTIDLRNERLMLTLKGAPKKPSLLRLPGQVILGGTVKAPDIDVPPRTKTVGGVINMLASAIAGRQEPLARDADCNALERQVMR